MSTPDGLVASEAMWWSGEGRACSRTTERAPAASSGVTICEDGFPVAPSIDVAFSAGADHVILRVSRRACPTLSADVDGRRVRVPTSCAYLEGGGAVALADVVVGRRTVVRGAGRPAVLGRADLHCPEGQRTCHRQIGEDGRTQDLDAPAD